MSIRLYISSLFFLIQAQIYAQADSARPGLDSVQKGSAGCATGMERSGTAGRELFGDTEMRAVLKALPPSALEKTTSTNGPQTVSLHIGGSRPSSSEGGVGHGSKAVKLLELLRGSARHVKIEVIPHNRLAVH